MIISIAPGIDIKYKPIMTTKSIMILSHIIMSISRFGTNACIKHIQKLYK